MGLPLWADAGTPPGLISEGLRAALGSEKEEARRRPNAGDTVASCLLFSAFLQWAHLCCPEFVGLGEKTMEFCCLYPKR